MNNRYKIDICSFSETKKKEKGNARYQNYILFYNGVRARGGVGLLVNKKYENSIDEVKYINQNIM